MVPAVKENRDKAKIAWQLTLALYACLLINLTFDHIVMRQTFYWPVWLMQTVPLLLILPGLIQRSPRSGTWLCFMILFHLLAAINNAALTGNMAFYGGMTTLVIALFTTSLLFVRWQRLQVTA